MTRILGLWLLIMATTLASGAIGCDQGDKDDKGAEKLGAKIDAAFDGDKKEENPTDDIKDAANSIEDSAREAGNQIEEGVKDAANEIEGDKKK